MTQLAINSTIALSSGHAMPRLGFGVYQARGDECRAAVTTALKVGYKMIDSAQAYHNEDKVGQALAASGVKRDSVFLTTKFMPGHDVPTPEWVYEQLQRSLPRLTSGDGYIDLMLIHAPRPNAAARAAEWAALVRAQKEGWIRSIGVSNFGVRHLKELPGPMPSVNQIELHPWCQQRDIVAYCAQKGIVVEAYCPLVRGQRADDPLLDRISKKHGKNWAQVLIRWSLQKGYVPLPKSVHPDRIKSNADVYDFELDAEDMQALEDCDLGAEGACSWNPVNDA